MISQERKNMKKKLFILTLLTNFFTQSAFSANSVPAFDHIVVVIEENHSLNQCIGNPDMPYFNSLANNGALFIKSYGWGHPSQPNYLALFSGSNQGITDNDVHPKINAPNLWSTLNAIGKSYASYSEDLPQVGSDVESNNAYARKHNPTPQFANVPRQANQTFNQWPTDFTTLPQVSFVVPNEDNDAHDGTLATADAWLKKNIGAYANWAKNNNSLLIITFDENVGSELEIPTLFYGAQVKTGIYDKKITHYSILRLLQDAFNTGAYAGNSATAASITDCWLTNTPPPPTPDFTINAVTTQQGDLNISFIAKNWISKSVVANYSINGQAVQQILMTNTNNTWTYRVSNLKNNDVITYSISYEWNGQTLQTTQQSITYVSQTPSNRFTQSVLMLDATTAQITFKPASVAQFVDVHYTIDNGPQVNIRMTNDNNTWSTLIKRLESNDKIHYSFTYEQNGPAYNSEWFDYTVTTTTTPPPPPNITYIHSVQPLAEYALTQVNFITNTELSAVTLTYAINQSAQKVVPMRALGSSSIWIVALPALQCSDNVSYAFSYTRPGNSSSTTPTFNYTR